MRKQTYIYEIEKVNVVNGRAKGSEILEYHSSSRLKIGNIYLSLPGLECGGYHVIKERKIETS